MADSTNTATDFSLEDWMQRPLNDIELGHGELAEKNKLTLKHSRIQGNLYFYWRNYKDSSNRGGQVYSNVPCRTQKQILSPDVAYLTPEIISQLGEPAVLPQSFPLIAEIVSLTDFAEEIIARSQS